VRIHECVADRDQDDTLVNGSTGVIVDFMTLPQAAQKGNVYLPSRAAFGSPNPAVEWPIVEFIPPKHAGVKRDVSRVLIPQMCVDVMNANGTEEASRYQVPLIVAFSLTIHKAQCVDRIHPVAEKTTALMSSGDKASSD
jgi:ATP-dependent DNA helicase PIF1